jgi:hypothetical protein
MDIAVRRHLLGIGSLVLVAGAVLLLYYGDGESARMVGLSLLRVGILASLLWLALPQVLLLAARFSTPLSVAVLAGLVIFAIRPRAFPFVAILIAVVVVLEFLGWLGRPLKK